ncbi:hypothetical protein P153DRAFT_376434 [Dothidotthia symphoricarpi CBS 119687]|uniref:Putative gamma-glutamylcyclotransferase n=1 Tax=Dothidotthia symphoricarpi CBS 119687 TaxID=1392245 RepID=A0A6A6ABH6_9PLEO|nr:uncharacterized protein P153DRAFT_376434 [Dothidotthia symphoricarpi CBS 119687]KAF2129170.1 hypothetical protein P153DRAFT_376434 [Dothidotthia symphoricarpi CBS 119687]
MDYFDDLEPEAMDAFCELNDEIAPLDTTPAPTLSSDMKDLLRSTKHSQTSTTKVKRKSCSMDYLFKISSPVTPAILACAAILPSQPRMVHGECENGVAQFCQVNELDVPKIKDWLAKTYPTLSPVFAPINKACKALSPISAYPTLGLDTSLPHRRPQSTVCSGFFPTQNQYPVWYFFYGTLANSSFLAELFCSPPGTIPVLVPALIRGGKLRTWGGKYHALVNSPGSQVGGWAYEVLSQEQEDILCMYETAKYEVVRVDITLNESLGRRCVVQGCTFRFAAEEHELDYI